MVNSATSWHDPKRRYNYRSVSYHVKTNLQPPEKPGTHCFGALSKVPGILVTGKCTISGEGFLRVFMALGGYLRHFCRTCCTKRRSAFLCARTVKWHKNWPKWAKVAWNNGLRLSRWLYMVIVSIPDCQARGMLLVSWSLAKRPSNPYLPKKNHRFCI